MIHCHEEYIKEQLILHTIELEMIERTNVEENEKWLCAERRAIEQWRVLEKKKKILHQERLEKEAKLKIVSYSYNNDLCLLISIYKAICGL